MTLPPLFAELLAALFAIVLLAWFAVKVLPRLFAEFEQHPARPLDLTGARDGYCGAWVDLPPCNSATGQAYLPPGTMPDMAGMKKSLPEER